MRTPKAVPKTIEDYIARFPPEVQEILQKIRETIKKSAPGAEETIGYQMPTFTLDGRYLVYLAGHKKHIGFYPAPIQHPAFRDQLAQYAAGQGTLRFPLDKPIPYALIRKIVKFRVQEARAQAAAASKTTRRKE